MTKRMLIDATHPEETRVVVLDRDQLVDFDFESSTKTQLKGNVYLAKVTRVEPSLQAAFVEYGGNRHGFLAFSEIHPDYYQIPQADREMLEKLEHEAAQDDQDNDAGSEDQTGADPAQAPQPDLDKASADDAGASADAGDENSGDDNPSADSDDDEGEPQAAPEAVREDSDQETADVADESARKRARLLRSYKIQEVIKRRQILLVQVVKEERGNKGAALTTYLSLAGRYCVLMPNTPRGGGISRKITNLTDRRRLKTVVQSLDVPQGMGLIVRTAGQERNKAELRRDYDYLLRQWSDIRDTTLESVAPALIYQEGDLIKRALRDLYSRDIEEVLVEGEDGYRSAKRLMQMMMPSHARRIKPYKEELPLFYRHKVEDQLDGMHSPVVYLPSGGSIVIHTTEALTAVDVNSGRSTRERHIDETALKTNLEAADEVARQLRLRDLAGLIVIDFIDMGEHRHQRQVERRLREALKLDRARLQVGRISMFGLLELSRQRLRASLQELSSQSCPVCQGLGVVRSTESCALHALRRIQEEGIRNEASVLQLNLPPEVALYLLNQKRDTIVRLEERYQMQVLVTIGADLLPSDIELDTVEQRAREGEDEEGGETRARDSGRDRKREREPEREPRRDRQERSERPAAADESDDEEGNRKRRRRRRRRRRDEEGEAESVAAPAATAVPAADAKPAEDGGNDEDAGASESSEPGAGDSGEDAPRRRRRRRGRRGARNERDDAVASDEPTQPETDEEAPSAPPQPAVGEAEALLAKLEQITAIAPGTPYMTPPPADGEPAEEEGATPAPEAVEPEAVEPEVTESESEAPEPVPSIDPAADAIEPPQATETVPVSLFEEPSEQDAVSGDVVFVEEAPVEAAQADDANLEQAVAESASPVPASPEPAPVEQAVEPDLVAEDATAVQLAERPAEESAEDDDVAPDAPRTVTATEEVVAEREEPALAANAAMESESQPGLSEGEAESDKPAQPERKGWWSRWVR